MPRRARRARQEVEVAAVARQAVHADDRLRGARRAPLGVGQTRGSRRGPSTGELLAARGVMSMPALRIASVALAQPVDDALAEHALRLAADEHADVPAGQADLGVVLAADHAAQRLRASSAG